MPSTCIRVRPCICQSMRPSTSASMCGRSASPPSKSSRRPVCKPTNSSRPLPLRSSPASENDSDIRSQKSEAHANSPSSLPPDVCMRTWILLNVSGGWPGKCNATTASSTATRRFGAALVMSARTSRNCWSAVARENGSVPPPAAGRWMVAWAPVRRIPLGCTRPENRRQKSRSIVADSAAMSAMPEAEYRGWAISTLTGGNMRNRRRSSCNDIARGAKHQRGNLIFYSVGIDPERCREKHAKSGKQQYRRNGQAADQNAPEWIHFVCCICTVPCK